MSHSLERAGSVSFLKPTTPVKKLSDTSSSERRTRVEDESMIEKQYTFGDVLGTGAFGVVREVTNKQTKEKFAMKIIAKDKPGSRSIQLLEREVEVLRRVNHPHIIQLEEVFETAKKMYLIMELCKGGEISDELRKRGYLKEEEAKRLMKRLTEAVVYMHDNDMVHRDLKLENILLSTADQSDGFNIKVTDFGLVHMKGLPGCDDLMHTRCGTLYYMAPEVLHGHDYTKMCDVWSMGVIMYTLLCGRVPFKAETTAKLEEVILQGELTFAEIEWISVSPVAKELVKGMLRVNTSERYTARTVLDDTWFTGKASHKVKNALALMREMDPENAIPEKSPPETSSPGPQSKSHDKLVRTEDRSRKASSLKSSKPPVTHTSKPRTQSVSVLSVSSSSLKSTSSLQSTSGHGKLRTGGPATKSAVLSSKRPTSGHSSKAHHHH